MNFAFLYSSLICFFEAADKWQNNEKVFCQKLIKIITLSKIWVQILIQCIFFYLFHQSKLKNLNFLTTSSKKKLSSSKVCLFYVFYLISLLEWNILMLSFIHLRQLREEGFLTTTRVLPISTITQSIYWL